MKKNKGFTLIEMVVAIGLLVILGGFSIAALTAIPQAKMRENAQQLKAEFELTRNYAKTHGTNATIQIKKVKEGIEITRYGAHIVTETKLLEDTKLELFYYITNVPSTIPYQLGTSDFAGTQQFPTPVSDSALIMEFTQTSGAIVGPHMVDKIILSNGSKNYTLIVQQDAGMMYFDYELEEVKENEAPVKLSIAKPEFVKGASTTTEMAIVQRGVNGQSVQPELSYDSRNIKISGVYRAVEPGKVYEIVFELKDPHNTKWVGGGTEPIKLYWTIY